MGQLSDALSHPVAVSETREGQVLDPDSSPAVMYASPSERNVWPSTPNATTYSSYCPPSPASNGTPRISAVPFGPSTEATTLSVRAMGSRLPGASLISYQAW